MKLLLVSPKMEKSNGGIAVWTNMYLDGARDSVIEPYLLNTAPVGKRAKNGTAKRNFLVEMWRTIKIFRDFSLITRKTEFDIVHLNTSCGRFGIVRDYLLLKQIKKKQPQAKIVLHYHCDIPAQVRSKKSKKYLGNLLKLCDCNFVLCQNSKTYLEKEMSATAIKVPNFVSEHLIVKHNREIRPNKLRAFFVGRISILKGAREIYALAEKNPDVVFSLVGSVSETVASWQKPENIHLLGPMPHERVLACMDEADVFVFPSHTEGFSMALAEAMARGLPAVATDVGANADMLEEQGGIVCPVGDDDALHQALQEIKNTDTREKMSSWCVNKVRENYTTDKVIAQFLEYYNHLLEI